MDVLEHASLPRRIRRGLLAAEKIAATLLLVAVTLLVVLQVVARYVFDRPLFWTDELARYCYVWLSFVAAVAERKPVPVTGEDGLKALLLAEAALKSVAEGRSVRVAEIG